MKGNTASCRIPPASAGSIGICRAGPAASCSTRLKLIRDFLAVDWDIHPEMVTHTFAIDTKTGRPYPDRTDPLLREHRLQRREERRRARGLHGLRPADPEERRADVQKG